MNHSPVSPWAVRGLYLFALVLFASPLIDLVSTVWPLRASDLGWRYGFLGLAAGYLHTPILALVLAMGVAFWQGHAGTLRSLAILSTVAAIAFVPVMAMWTLDVVQMRGLRVEETQTGILVGGVIQEFKYLGACLVLACLGVGGVRTSKHLRASGPSRDDAPGILRRAGA